MPYIPQLSPAPELSVVSSTSTLAGDQEVHTGLWRGEASRIQMAASVHPKIILIEKLNCVFSEEKKIIENMDKASYSEIV